ncbi:uncharacterized protein J3D65DRAFT_668138 [Phyllosticta citribraziliensis]|uniref:Uncharacterized protein n=1 Tax=Phyllosticta citribraziliensis TaxID=989973 RepID=A0ABR1LQN7_9PEZI
MSRFHPNSFADAGNLGTFGSDYPMSDTAGSNKAPDGGNVNASGSGQPPDTQSLQQSPAKPSSIGSSGGETAMQARKLSPENELRVLRLCRNWTPNLTYGLWVRGMLKDDLQQFQWLGKCLKMRLDLAQTGVIEPGSSQGLNTDVVEDFEENVAWILASVSCQDYVEVLDCLKPAYLWNEDWRIETMLSMYMPANQLPFGILRTPQSMQQPLQLVQQPPQLVQHPHLMQHPPQSVELATPTAMSTSDSTTFATMHTPQNPPENPYTKERPSK